MVYLKKKISRPQIGGPSTKNVKNGNRTTFIFNYFLHNLFPICEPHVLPDGQGENQKFVFFDPPYYSSS